MRNGLIKDSFDINGWKPIVLSKQDIENAHGVVTLDCLLPETDSRAHPSTLWTVIPISKGYIEARAEIIKQTSTISVGINKGREPQEVTLSLLFSRLKRLNEILRHESNLLLYLIRFKVTIYFRIFCLKEGKN